MKMENTTMINSNEKKMMNKKRFSDEQVRSLESIFENESKLEAKKKVEVANQVGLAPSQVAIWFQNKRARFKSKQLEREYSDLRANYIALSSQFELLKEEKHSLFLQVQELKHESQSCNSTSRDQKSKDREERDRKPALSMAGSDYGVSSIVSSSSDEGTSENNNNNNNEKNYYFLDEETDKMLRISDYSDPEWLLLDHQHTAIDGWWDSWCTSSN